MTSFHRGDGSVVPALLCSALLGACSPALDWREVRFEDSGLTALMPCRPSSHARSTALAGQKVRMYLYVCDSGDATFAVGYADVGDLKQVEPALSDLRRASADNVQGRGGRQFALDVPGMSPSPMAGRSLYEGRLPSGAATQLSAMYFAEGTLVYQVTMMAPTLDQEALETFSRGLKLGGSR